MWLSRCNHTEQSALRAWPQTRVANFCVLRHSTTAVLKADQLRSPDRNLDARQGQVISFGILNILVLISTILKGLPQRRLVAAFKVTSFAPETEMSQKDDPEVALDAARCAAADSKSAA